MKKAFIIFILISITGGGFYFRERPEVQSVINFFDPEARRIKAGRAPAKDDQTETVKKKGILAAVDKLRKHKDSQEKEALEATTFTRTNGEAVPFLKIKTKPLTQE